jgi:Xaa-Pro aminopeptidase
LYGFIVAYQKALLRYIKPGITPDQVMADAAKDMQAVLDGISFSKPIYRNAAREALAFKGHLSHPVGMSVHDVGNYRDRELQAGMVFSIDPMLWVPEETLYVRMEDVVVVTADGVENLSGSLAIDIDDIEALLQQDGILQNMQHALW